MPRRSRQAGRERAERQARGLYRVALAVGAELDLDARLERVLDAALDLVQADGADAWRLIVQHRPALALLDVQMPGRSGLNLTRALRSDPALRGMRVILLSGNTQAEDIEAGLAAGADRYLTKPFSPLELLSLVQELMTVA